MSKVLNVIQNKNKRNLFLLVVLFSFFSNSSVFAQKAADVPVDGMLMDQNSLVIESPAKVSNSVSNSNVNFILWFMGTKEDMGKSFSDDGMYSKKSFMTSGREPNHLMVKTLLKKALNIKSC